MPIDRLQGLLQRFRVSAQMFHSGPLCGINDFLPEDGHGQLHLVRRGPLEVRHAGAADERIDQPSLLLYPRPLAHRFSSDEARGADMACANIRLDEAADGPIANALPAVLILPLAALPGAAVLLEQLFDEAFAQRCGRQQIVDRLFEVVLILILRHLLDSGRIDSGPLAGLGHPRLARALIAIHDEPARPWSLAALAERAGMSRSRFAEVFSDLVGIAPAAYLARHRIALAQDLLRRDRPLALVAEAVGYSSPAALSRAFSAHTGMSPRRWRQGLAG